MQRNWLKTLRKARRLTQAAVAAKIGVTLRAYQNWEQGDRNPDPTDRIALERLLGAEVAKQFRAEDESRYQARKEASA